MRKIHFYIGTGYAGAEYNEIMEFEDNATDEEVEEAYKDWKENQLDCSWWEE